MIKLVTFVALALLAAGCAYSSPGTVDGDSLPGTPQSDDTVGTLVKARHPECDVGHTVMEYLASGDNQGSPSLDLLFADSVGVSQPQARAITSEYIQQCDAQADQADVTAAQEQARVADEARTAEAARAVSAQEQQACDAIDGRYDADDRRCYSTATDDPACILFGEPQYLSFTNGAIESESYGIAEETMPGCWQ